MPTASARFVEVFCTVVEAGNFSIAAHRLGLTPAAVSRSVATHEERLGVQLFRRTTRSMKLTDQGAAYYESCSQALALLDTAERSLTNTRISPRGLIRISAGTTYAHHRLLPFVARFGADHPEVAFELDVSNRNIDFVADGYDLAIRAGALDDSAVVARKLEDAPLGCFASPAYLASRGKPKQPSDLAAHTMIGFLRPSTGRAMAWLFRERDGTAFEVTPARSLRCSDDFLACIALARAGAGIVQTYRFTVADDLARGTLVEVLDRYAGASRPFTLLMPARPAPSLAARTFADALLAAVR